jgi:hypothetical protein
LWILACRYTITVNDSVHQHAPLWVIAKYETSITRRMI